MFYIKLPGASPPPEHHPGHPGGLTAPPIPQAAKKKRCARIFPGLSPITTRMLLSLIETLIKQSI